MACVEVENIIDKFKILTQKPAKFLTVQTDDVKDEIKTLVKSLYDYTKSQESKKKKGKRNALPELIVQDFDEEQIWQQLELQNTECWDHLVWEVANCISAKDKLIFPVKTVEDQKEDTDEMEENSVDENMSESDNEEETLKKKSNEKEKVRKSIVDDKFFKLQEMEKFLLKEEKNEGKTQPKDSDEESIDMFELEDSDDGEEDGKEMMYNDFFDGQDNDINEEQPAEEPEIEQQSEASQSEEEEMPEPKKKEKRVKFAGIASDDSDDDSGSDDNEEPLNNNRAMTKEEKKSEFELRQQRLQQQISRLEEKTLTDAPWQLKGEVVGAKRPENSLLGEMINFDVTTRPAPVITEQTTITLEDIIKQRIKDKAWDDVARKEKPVDDQLSFSKKEVLDHSKSKLSLAQVYEAEYLKQKQALSGDVEEEKEPEAHTQIREAMSKLFTKLDALSHYHYTPKPPQAEVKIVTNTPAISMEEVAPVATSDATLLAPEEVKKKRKGELMSKEERTQTDKNRERRKKKKLQRKKGQVTKVTEHRNTSKGTEASDKSLKTSKAFFEQLNNDTTSLIKKKKPIIKNKGQ